jgi:flagellar biosynthesis protein FlhB
MAAHDSAQERTEQPTQKRLREARERGQRPQSRDLHTLLLMAGGVGGLLLAGGPMCSALADFLRHGLLIDRARVMDSLLMAPTLGSAAMAGMSVIAPLLIVACAATVIGAVALGGPLWSTQALSFHWSKLDPWSGLRRIFSGRNLAELVKALARFALVAVIAAGSMYMAADEVTGLTREPLAAALSHSGWLVLRVLLALCAGLILIAAIDVPFQLWTHRRQLRMSRQEIKDELIETEGRPEIRGRIRALQRERARRRMMAALPTADVVIVNPTHFAVALRFNEGMSAPRVVAKGFGPVAVKIREIATQYGVAIFHAPALARALYASTRLDQEIPAALYVAVAQVLAYVYQLRAVVTDGAPPPAPPTDLPVPVELAERVRIARAEADEDGG